MIGAYISDEAIVFIAKLLIWSFLEKALYSQFITLKPEANDNPFRIWCNKRFVSKFLPGVNVGNMNFHHRRFNGFYSISNSHGSMCISRCIQDDSIKREIGFL